MKNPPFTNPQNSDLSEKQYDAFIEILLQQLSPEGLAIVGERWELICAEHGWHHPTRGLSSKNRQIEAVLAAATELAHDMPEADID